MNKQKKRSVLGWDPYLLIPYLILCIIGIVMVYSASADVAMQVGGTARSYLVKQSIFALVGIGIFFLLSRVNLTFWRSKYTLGFLLGILIVLLVYVRFFGAAVNGARGWVNLGPVSIQPAEVCKFFLTIYLANQFARYENLSRSDYLRKLRKPIILTIVLIGLILSQPDTGGALINASIFLVIIMASRIPWKYGATALVGGFLALLIGLPYVAQLFAKIGGYRAARFVAYLNPFANASGSGTQLVNSYYAISNGGIFGSGIGNSIQKMGYLPESNTDFILAIISEELGLVTVLIILALLATLICRIILLGIRSNNLYETLLCYGTGTFFAVETMFNVGAVCGLLPITGVTLPFISYGGSSMFVLSASLGLVANVERRMRRQKARRQQEVA
ncbi:FtsW/RodA/SpoVE family cell cycle protein [uncultured Limosilactobacillus sp.]|uniref:FtsW/RodA/SpoVE family cell cycle protein n=1 Tax=uncultured Limosilactobacillus sp. TaxID=2837629 RepID=UPI0025CE4526|nr:FtsW/RodA/SpoVE family cell cycle protein [uncultured Limosilactobacillus sp.]